MTEQSTFILVGHCGPDVFMLRAAISHAVPDVPIEAVNDIDAIEPFLKPSCVLLVNRVLDGRFRSGDGIELIRQAMQGDAPPVAMLISNFAQAQAQAVAAGAQPGFGKSDLYDERTAEILKAAAVATT